MSNKIIRECEFSLKMGSVQIKSTIMTINLETEIKMEVVETKKEETIQICPRLSSIQDSKIFGLLR